MGLPPVWHVVEQHLQVPLVGGGDEVIEVLEAPVLGINGRVIGHVIAEVRVRRRIEGRQPYRGRAEPCDVVEPRHHLFPAP